MSKKTRKKPNRARRSSPKIRYETGGRNLTSQAGLIPVIKFLDGLGFSGLFHQVVRHERQPNARYLLGEAVFLVLIGLAGGARSLSQCLVLWSDGVLQRVAGWVRIPDESTVGRLFKEVSERHISELENLVHEARKRVWGRALRAGTSR
ncbi:transposase, partial [Stenotrophomonas sp. CC120223-11]|uniref:transposase n=1 Tax=Stenotrophomonas sp. CC120223-11 TaxID=1378090 RepID=UPI000BCA689F